MKIAVLRANALGDFIFILPALQALRDTFPQAEIILLGKEWHRKWLAGRPGPVDRVEVVPPYPGVGEPENFVPNQNELDRFFTKMQQEQFDLAFQLHGGGRNSNPFVLRLGARRTVGLKTPDAPPLDINVAYVYYFSEILRYLEVVEKVGARPVSIIPEVSTTPKDFLEAEMVLQNRKDKPLAVIHPGATDLRRRWPASHFAALAGHLLQEGFHVCVTGTSSERAIVDELLRSLSSPERVQDCCNRLSLSGLTGLLASADLLVANDTGPLHLARALGTPTVGIFWCGNSVTGTFMNSDVHRVHISWNFNCPLCGTSSKKLTNENTQCQHLTSFITDISPEEVRETVSELQQQIKERSAKRDEKEQAA